MIKKEYKTKRLILLYPNTSMTESVLEFYIKNRDFLTPFEPIRHNIFYTKSAQKKIMLKDIENMKNSSAIRFLIVKKEEPKKVIGVIALNNIIKGDFLSCHLAYKLDEEEQGSGIMTEALKTFIDVVAFFELKLHRIEANIMPRNKRSINLSKRLGFEYEGLGKKYLRINGKWEDHIHMVLFNDYI